MPKGRKSNEALIFFASPMVGMEIVPTGVGAKGTEFIVPNP